MRGEGWRKWPSWHTEQLVWLEQDRQAKGHGRQSGWVGDGWVESGQVARHWPWERMNGGEQDRQVGEFGVERHGFGVQLRLGVLEGRVDAGQEVRQMPWCRYMLGAHDRHWPVYEQMEQPVEQFTH